MMWFLQMAQFSTTMSQDQRATAFHLKGAKKSEMIAPGSSEGQEGGAPDTHLLDLETGLAASRRAGFRGSGGVFHIHVGHFG